MVRSGGRDTPTAVSGYFTPQLTEERQKCVCLCGLLFSGLLASTNMFILSWSIDYAAPKVI